MHGLILPFTIPPWAYPQPRRIKFFLSWWSIQHSRAPDGPHTHFFGTSFLAGLIFTSVQQNETFS